MSRDFTISHAILNYDIQCVGMDGFVYLGVPFIFILTSQLQLKQNVK